MKEGIEVMGLMFAGQLFISDKVPFMWLFLNVIVKYQNI